MLWVTALNESHAIQPCTWTIFFQFSHLLVLLSHHLICLYVVRPSLPFSVCDSWWRNEVAAVLMTGEVGSLKRRLNDGEWSFLRNSSTLWSGGKIACYKLINRKQTNSKKQREYMIDLVTEWLTDWLTNLMTDLLTGWLNDWLTNWLDGWLTDWMTDWLTDWLTDQLTDWSTD